MKAGIINAKRVDGGWLSQQPINTGALNLLPLTINDYTYQAIYDGSNDLANFIAGGDLRWTDLDSEYGLQPAVLSVNFGRPVFVKKIVMDFGQSDGDFNIPVHVRVFSYSQQILYFSSTPAAGPVTLFDDQAMTIPTYVTGLAIYLYAGSSKAISIKELSIYGEDATVSYEQTDGIIKLKSTDSNNSRFFVPEDGEILYNYDTRKVIVGDGLNPCWKLAPLNPEPVTVEDGTWTPTLTMSSGTGSITLEQTVGFYTKIGPMVFLNYYIWISNVTVGDSGILLIGGLPFSFDSSSTIPIMTPITTTGVTYSGQLRTYGGPGATEMQIAQYLDDGGEVSLDLTSIAPGAQFFGTVIYRTTS
jgi:hypothetical protein